MNGLVRKISRSAGESPCPPGEQQSGLIGRQTWRGGCLYSGPNPLRPAEVTSLAAPGLSSQEAERRLRASGPNEIPEVEERRLRRFLAKFWSPVPWMLEAAVLLELLLRHALQACIISTLLVV